MAAVYDTASSFTIIELTGQMREVRLTGRGLPYRPFSLKTKQRAEVEWYSGSPEGVASINGPEEGPTSIKGAWKERFLGDVQASASGSSAPFTLDGEPITSARLAIFTLEDICRQGQLLEVQWDQVIRRGILTEFEATWQNVYDVEWSMDFEWISRGQPTVAAAQYPAAQPSATAGELYERMGDIDAALPTTLPVSPTILDQLSDYTNKLENFVNNVQGSAQNLALRAAAPADMARRVVSSVSGLIGTASDMMDLFQSIPAEYIGVAASAKATYDSTASEVKEVKPFVERLQQRQYWRNIYDQTSNLFNSGVEQREGYILDSSDGILAVYTAQDNDDLQSVSMRFYSTPDQWRQLLMFNYLSTPELTLGQTVLIPDLALISPA